MVARNRIKSIVIKNGNNQSHEMRLKELKKKINSNFVANIETLEFMKMNFVLKNGNEVIVKVICNPSDEFWIDLSSDEFIYLIRAWADEYEYYSAAVENQVKANIFKYLSEVFEI